MANITVAQQAVDSQLAVLTLAQSLAAIIKDPKIVEASAKTLIDATTMSAERKEEALKAEAAIEKAAKDKAELEAAQKNFDIETETQRNEIDKKTAELKALHSSYDTKVAQHEQDHSAQLALIDSAKAEFNATRLNVEDGLNKRGEATRQTEQDQKAKAEQLAIREAAVLKTEKALAEEAYKLAARKKKLLALAKED